MHRATTLRLVLLLALVLAPGACQRQGQLVEQHLLEFGTIITITLVVDDLPKAERILEEVEQRLKTYRKQWHAWEDSDLTRFNRALSAGKTTDIPPSLLQLLHFSQHYYRATDGLFNPAMGKLIAAQGFHGSDANRESIAQFRQDLPGMADLIIEGQRARSLNADLQIDLGGIAKGYALALIADYLDTSGIDNYLLNAGGDLKTSGNRFGHPWRIAVQNPFAPGAVAQLELQGKHSLFTSGNYERRYWRGERMTHHIIDPRSGNSSRGQSSATVLTGDPVLGDVAATTLMIDGLEGHDRLAKSLQIDQFLLISDEREIIISQKLADKLDILVSWPIKIVN